MRAYIVRVVHRYEGEPGTPDAAAKNLRGVARAKFDGLTIDRGGSLRPVWLRARVTR